MELAAEFVKFFFQRRNIQIQLRRQPEKREIVDRRRRLNFPAGLTKMRGAHRSARPAGVRFLGQRFVANRGQRGFGHCFTTSRKRASPSTTVPNEDSRWRILPRADRKSVV